MIRVTFVFLFCSTAVFAADNQVQVNSGLRPGDTAGAFYIEDITGPRKGSSLCYACAFGKRAVVNIQTTKITAELAKAIKKLDGLVDSADSRKPDSKHAFVVYLTEDPDAAAEELETLARKLDLKHIPLTIYDELTGPRSYKISEEAEVTVMMWDQTKVKYNHAFAPGQLDEAAVEKIVRDAKDHLKALTSSADGSS